MERFFVPFAAKINSQRHVAAVRDAFTLSFPLTMAGSMVLLINYVFLDPTGFVASLLHLGDLIPNLADYQAVLSSVINGTTNILAILIASAISTLSIVKCCPVNLTGSLFFIITYFLKMNTWVQITRK